MLSVFIHLSFLRRLGTYKLRENPSLAVEIIKDVDLCPCRLCNPCWSQSYSLNVTHTVYSDFYNLKLNLATC